MEAKKLPTEPGNWWGRKEQLIASSWESNMQTRIGPVKLEAKKSPSGWEWWATYGKDSTTPQQAQDQAGARAQAIKWAHDFELATREVSARGGPEASWFGIGGSCYAWSMIRLAGQDIYSLSAEKQDDGWWAEVRKLKPSLRWGAHVVSWGVMSLGAAQLRANAEVNKLRAAIPPAPSLGGDFLETARRGGLRLAIDSESLQRALAGWSWPPAGPGALFPEAPAPPAPESVRKPWRKKALGPDGPVTLWAGYDHGEGFWDWEVVDKEGDQTLAAGEEVDREQAKLQARLALVRIWEEENQEPPAGERWLLGKAAREEVLEAAEVVARAAALGKPKFTLGCNLADVVVDAVTPAEHGPLKPPTIADDDIPF